MHRFLLHNDEIRDAGDRIVSPGQVGLLNGWGVFSTVRTYDGVLFAWERHWARMQRDAERLRVPFPKDSQWLEERLHRLVEANQAWNATLRVVVIRNRGGMWEGPAATRDFDVVAFTADVNQWGASVKLGVRRRKGEYVVRAVVERGHGPVLPRLGEPHHGQEARARRALDPPADRAPGNGSAAQVDERHHRLRGQQRIGGRDAGAAARRDSSSRSYGRREDAATKRP